MPPENGWPDIMNSYRNSRSVFSGPGRLFLCLMIIVTPDGVSKAKATNTKAEYCNKSFNRQHKRRPPFQYFRSKTDYVNGGSQSLRRGPAVHHLGDTQKYSIIASRRFQQNPVPWNRWKAVLFCISYQSHIARRKTVKPLFYRLFGQNVRYSNSIVPGGLLVKSYITRFTPLTSLIILPIILCSTPNGISAASAVIKSTVFTARSATA